MAENIREFSDATWDEEVSRSDIPVMVDFWAPWCMPCKYIVPIVEEISNEYVGRVKVGKLNVDENPATAAKYSVMSIPTVMIFKNGEVNGQIIGAQAKDKFIEAIDAALKP